MSSRRWARPGSRNVHRSMRASRSSRNRPSATSRVKSRFVPAMSWKSLETRDRCRAGGSASLERAQQHRLFVETELADLVEEQDAAVGGEQQARPLADRAGEGAADVPEEGGHRRVGSGLHMSERIDIDGAQGEGGGQILRSALALSLITGRPLPHRPGSALGGRSRDCCASTSTAVHAAARSAVRRATAPSWDRTTLSFEPGECGGGDYRLAIGTAGSTTLVLQTVLPALLIAREPSRLTLEGGTHNPYGAAVRFPGPNVPAGPPPDGRVGIDAGAGVRTASTRRAVAASRSPSSRCPRCGRLSLLERGPHDDHGMGARRAGCPSTSPSVS